MLHKVPVMEPKQFKQPTAHYIVFRFIVMLSMTMIQTSSHKAKSCAGCSKAYITA